MPAGIGVGALLCFIALWIATHPYAGIRHDAILYAAQAMLHLRPEVFRGDLFFAFGSQDDYTLFGRLYAMAVSGAGLTTASRALWALSQALWFAVALAWLRRVVTPGALPLVAAAVFAMPAFYGSEQIFRVTEPFLSGRSFAEPVVLCGLLAWARERRVAAVVLVGCAFVVHPIMALPGIAVLALLGLCQGRPGRWACEHRASAVAVLLVAAAGFVALLAGLGAFSVIDDRWYELVTVRSTLVAVELWGSVDWARVLLPPAILLIAARDADARLRPILVAIAACALLGLLASLMACLTRWELGVQAQFWRLVWPAAWFAPVAALCVAASLPAARTSHRILLVAAIPALMLTVQGWWEGGWALAVVYLLFLAAIGTGRVEESPASRRVAIILAVLVCAVALLDGVLTLVIRYQLIGKLPAYESALPALLMEKFGWLVLPLLVLAARRMMAGRASPRAVLAGGVACIVLSLSFVDGRGPMRAHFEGLVRDGIPGWSDAISPGASVYWPQHLEHVWFVLGRRSYISGGQLAGGIFNRSKTLEGNRRERNVAVLQAAEEIKPTRSGVARPGPGSLTPADLRRACADPELGFVVLQKDLGPSVAPPFVDHVSGRTHRLYRCADFRAS